MRWATYIDGKIIYGIGRAVRTLSSEDAQTRAILAQADDPLPEGVEVAALAPAIPIIIIVTSTLDKMNKARKLLQAARAANVLAQRYKNNKRRKGTQKPHNLPPHLPHSVTIAAQGGYSHNVCVE